MTAFMLLHPLARAAILFLILLLLLANGHILAVAVMRSRRWKIGPLALLSMLLCYVLLVVLSARLYEVEAGQEPHPVTGFLAGLPAGAYLVFLLLGFGLALLLLRRERQHHRSAVTKAAIKESADNLPAGLCFGAESGMVLLSNHRMESLCHTLTGRDLQNAEVFWQTVRSGELKSGAQRVSSGESPILRFADGQAWTFTRRIIEADGKAVTQITAVDTTELDAARIRLEQGNEALAEMNARLRRYGENITEVTAGEERLATKVRLHDELGHTLLTTRRILAYGKMDGEAQPILDLWKRNVAVLRTGAEAKKVTMLEHLADAAADVGITLQVDGCLPQADKSAGLLIITAGSEALNNAVRHAGATELYLTVTETAAGYTAVFTNNGAVPDGEITEGGGLSALRARTQRQDGKLEIASRPIFQMTVTLPKGKEE